MSKIEALIDGIGDATRQLFEEIGDACKELASDLKECGEVKYLRPGAVLRCCCPGTNWRYGIYLGGSSLVSVDSDGVPHEYSFSEFLSENGATEFFTAAQKRIALGGRKIEIRARELLDEQACELTSEAMSVLCLGNAFGKVDETLESMFGSFAWLKIKMSEED